MLNFYIDNSSVYRYMMDSDVRIDKFELSYKSYRLRIPLKFGSVVVEESISLIVKAIARNRSGREAVGLGSMPLVCEWAFQILGLNMRISLKL